MNYKAAQAFLRVFRGKRGARTRACRVGTLADTQATDKRRQEWRRGTHECVRHALNSSRLACVPLLLLLLLTSCGYHVSGRGDLLPKAIHTIAIPAFDNVTVRYRLTDRLPEAISREFIARTHYQVIPDASQADAVLRGSIVNYVSFPTTFDQTTGRASGLQVNVTMQISLVERATGKVLFTRPSFEAKQRYEFSVSSQAYFDESDTALDRLCKDVARDVVTAILENF